MPENVRRIIRAPNHLGDVVLALPAIAAAPGDVMVRRPLAAILELAEVGGHVLPLDRGLRGWREATATLRRGGYTEGVLLSASFSAAWLFRWGGVRRLRGTATDARGWMLSERIAPGALEGHHRINQFKLILGQDTSGAPDALALNAPAHALAAWRVRLPGGRGPLVGMLPGANAEARRWPTDRFASVACAIRETGARVVVLGGPFERDLTAAVARAVPDATDLGGRTDLTDLAAILSLCDLLLTNDTGPMHLAGALGTPTVTLWGPSDPDEVRQTGSADVRVTGAALPCKPCYRNACPRRGLGVVLPDAREECMRLIEVPKVLAAIDAALRGEVRP